MKVKEGQIIAYRSKKYKNIKGTWAEEVEQIFYTFDIDEMINELTAWRDSVIDYGIVDDGFGDDSLLLTGWTTQTVSNNTTFRINEKLEKERQSTLTRNKKIKENKERQERATYEKLKSKYEEKEEES